MLIKLPEHDLMANFRYNVHTSKSWSSLQTGDYGDFNSVCSETMAGVQRSKANGKFQCMWGKKTSPNAPSTMNDDRETATMPGSFAQTGS